MILGLGFRIQGLDLFSRALSLSLSLERERGGERERERDRERERESARARTWAELMAAVGEQESCRETSEENTLIRGGVP